MTNHRRKSRYTRSNDHTNPIVDSTYGEYRFRGTLLQVIEKYEKMADEELDPVKKAGFLQQAEHYIRTRNKLITEKETGRA